MSFPDRDTGLRKAEKLPIERAGHTRRMTSIPHQPFLDENHLELRSDPDIEIIVVGTTRGKHANGLKNL